MSEAITISEYARLRGVSHTAVQQRIKAGALRTSVAQRDGRWMILDVEAANAEWDANTRPRFGPRTATAGSPIADATLRERRARAWLAELDIAQRTGKMVPTHQVEAFLANEIIETRTGLLSVPSKAKLRLPHLTTNDLIVIGELIRHELQRLAERPPWRGTATAGDVPESSDEQPDLGRPPSEDSA